MKGGSEWKILEKNFTGSQSFLFNFDSKKYSYKIQDNKLYRNVLMWIGGEDGDEWDLKEAGKLIDDGKKLEIYEPVYGLYGYSENVKKQQLKEGTYSIKKFVKSHKEWWDTNHEFDIVKDEADEADEVDEADEAEVAAVADKEFILFNPKNRIINYIKDEEDKINFKNNIGINKLNILKILKKNYNEIMELNSDDFMKTQINDMLDNFVTLLKSITK